MQLCIFLVTYLSVFFFIWSFYVRTYDYKIYRKPCSDEQYRKSSISSKTFDNNEFAFNLKVCCLIDANTDTLVILLVALNFIYASILCLGHQRFSLRSISHWHCSSDFKIGEHLGVVDQATCRPSLYIC